MARPGFPVPDDYIESGAGKRCWVNCIFYGDTIEEVAEKKRKYLKKYPPQGYSTNTVSNINRHPDGYYVLKVQRWSTCD